MIDKNNVLVFQCIMALNKCDMVSAIKFAEYNQTCYNLAMAAVNEKDEEFKVKKQQWIDKACEWLKDNKEHPLIGCEDTGLSGFLTEEFIADFRKAMEGGEE